jgi:hypothetical protein
MGLGQWSLLWQSPVTGLMELKRRLFELNDDH